MKPSAMNIYRKMKKDGCWWSVREVMIYFPTNTPTKRLSELHRAGMIEKIRNPDDPRFMLYRALEATL